MRTARGAAKILLLLTPFGVCAENRVDVAKADLRGITLGMNENEVIAALRSLNIPDKSIQASLSMGKSEIYDKRLTSTIAVQLDGESYRFSFEARLPENEASPTTLTRIAYDLPFTLENANALLYTAIEKYGQPTTQFGNIYHWCQNPVESTFGAACTRIPQPKITVSRALLTIEDPIPGRLIKEHIEASRKAQPRI